MGHYLSSSESLTDSYFMAKSMWEDVENGIKQAKRDDILSSNPVILDVGGGMGYFSKYVNNQGFFCVSLDKQDISVGSFGNPVRGEGYMLPFPDSSFDIVYERGMFDPRVYNLDYSLIIQEVSRVLKEKGIFSICDHDIPSLEDIEKSFKCLNPDSSDYLTFWEKR